jgi:NADPH:quinone reductase-like Zn-dependent oxidoreductase
VAVVSNESKFEHCQKLGAVGCVNRRKFNHWGRLPHWESTEAMNEFSVGARAFGKAIWDVLGERRNPRIVFEHPGQDTVATSIFVADTGGMVVICAGTTGYNADVDLRYLWMRQKRLQGSHFANDPGQRLQQPGPDGKSTFSDIPFDQTGDCHSSCTRTATRTGKHASGGAPQSMTTRNRR